ncbi:DUF2520 domain-containing protein [Candidatus Bipolaricaulota bacterium]|nr:DUF2520 domain-containing protein [Candidatus Bipolaricaulota bacterium]
MSTHKSVRIGIVGAGRTGSVLGRSLHGAEYPVIAVASRSHASANRLARAIPGAHAEDHPQAVADQADLVLLSVPDDVIADVCTSIGWRSDQAAIHCSGAGSLDLLSHATEDGAAAGTFHPLQTFAEIQQGIANLPGSTFAIEASSDVLKATLKAMAHDLGGHPLVLSPGDKILYHASAVMIANYFVALADAASSLWSEFGSDQAQSLPALLPLARGTLANLEAVGLPAALTGPIARGDVGTVQDHLAALEVAPEILALYRALGLRTVSIALAQQGIDPATANRLTKALRAKTGSGEPS